MEEDIQNHSPTVMFRGTPCSSCFYKTFLFKKLNINWFLDNLILHPPTNSLIDILKGGGGCSLFTLTSITNNHIYNVHIV